MARGQYLRVVATECAHCGAPITPRKHTGGQRYCGPYCRKAAWLLSQIAKMTSERREETA